MLGVCTACSQWHNGVCMQCVCVRIVTSNTTEKYAVCVCVSECAACNQRHNWQVCSVCACVCAAHSQWQSCSDTSYPPPGCWQCVATWKSNLPPPGSLFHSGIAGLTWLQFQVQVQNWVFIPRVPMCKPVPEIFSWSLRTQVGSPSGEDCFIVI